MTWGGDEVAVGVTSFIVKFGMNNITNSIDIGAVVPVSKYKPGLDGYY